LEGPDVSNSVQAQSTNDYGKTSDYDISSSDDKKPERKEQSSHVYCHSKDEILHHNENLGNHWFQQLHLDCGTDNVLPSFSTDNSFKGIDNMLQSSANCNTEEKEPDGDRISYEIIAIPPQTRKRKMTTRRRNALSVQEALELGEGSIHIWGGQKFKRLYLTLNFISCCFSGYHLITVCNEAYYSKCENTNAWYETDFISSFAALISHKNHVGSIQFDHCLLPMEKAK
jgi:hypothetical protein